MADYFVEIDGKHSQPQVEADINGEEAGGSEFISSQIKTLGTRTTNLARFKELPPGTRPAKAVSVVMHGNAPPPRKAPFWTGLMIISSTIQQVDTCR